MMVQPLMSQCSASVRQSRQGQRSDLCVRCVLSPMLQPGYETASTDTAETEILLLGHCIVEIGRIFREPNPDTVVKDAPYISATVSHCHTLGCPRRILHTRENKLTPSVTQVPAGLRIGRHACAARVAPANRKAAGSWLLRGQACTAQFAPHARKRFTFKRMRKHRISNVMLWLCSN